MYNKFPVGNYSCNYRYVLDVPQFDPRHKQDSHGCPKCPDRLRGSPGLLFSGTESFDVYWTVHHLDN